MLQVLFDPHAALSRVLPRLVVTGNQLAISMYPYVPFSLFKDQFDINYNEVMLAFEQQVVPLLVEVQRTTDAQTDAQLQVYLESLPADAINQLNVAIVSLFNFCCAGQVQPCQDPTCQELGNLGVALHTLTEFPSGPQLRTVVSELIAAFEQYNPFNVLGTLNLGDVDPGQIYSVNRGGVLQNLTNQFAIMDEEIYYQTVARAFHNQFTFEEYTLVSDGRAGSTACIVSSMVQQLWNNRDEMWNGDFPPTPLTIVTYGGTKEASGTTVAGFPASVQNVKIEIPLITSGLLSMLGTLAPNETAVLISDINEYYQSFLPVPPFFADSLPSMPVFNYYR